MSAPLRYAAEAGLFHAPRFRAALAVSPRRCGETAAFVNEGWAPIMYDLELTQPGIPCGGLSAAAAELAQAIEQYRRESGRVFPTWNEVLEIISSLGVRTHESHSNSVQGGRTERRREPRYVPANPGTYLGWWEGEEFLAEPGTLCNFSEGGAAIAMDADLPGGAKDSVWLCVADRGRVEWVPARLVGQDGRVVRIQFQQPLPFALFNLLI